MFRSHSCRCSSRVASPVATAAWKVLEGCERWGVNRVPWILSFLFSTAGSRGGEALSEIVDFYPEDTNALQISCRPVVGGTWFSTSFRYLGVVVQALGRLGQKDLEC